MLISLFPMCLSGLFRFFAAIVHFLSHTYKVCLIKCGSQRVLQLTERLLCRHEEQCGSSALSLVPDEAEVGGYLGLAASQCVWSENAWFSESLCVCVKETETHRTWVPEDSIRSLRARIVGACELPTMGAWNQLGSSGWAGNAELSLRLSSPVALDFIVFKRLELRRWSVVGALTGLQNNPQGSPQPSVPPFLGIWRRLLTSPGTS